MFYIYRPPNYQTPYNQVIESTKAKNNLLTLLFSFCTRFQSGIIEVSFPKMDKCFRIGTIAIKSGQTCAFFWKSGTFSPKSCKRDMKAKIGTIPPKSGHLTCLQQCHPYDIIGGINFSGQIRSDYITLERIFGAESESK